MAIIKLSGKSVDVQGNMNVQPQNRLPGVRTWTIPKRMTALSGFFMRSVRAHLSMVGRAGQLKGWPGFFGNRFLTPVRFTTSIVRNAVVSPLAFTKGFAHE
jgi:hypothetical protein